MNNNTFVKDTMLKALYAKMQGTDPEIIEYVKEFFTSNWPYDAEHYERYMNQLFCHDVLYCEEYEELMSYIH